MYKVVAQVEFKVSEAPQSRIFTSIPTFFLNENQLGIVNDQHAIRIAEEILNPSGSKDVIPHVDVIREDWYCVD